MQTRFMGALLVATVTAVAGSGGEATSVGAAQSGSCEALAGLKLTHASIVSAAVVSEGPLTAGRAGGPAPLTVPERCVVKGIARPSSDSVSPAAPFPLVFGRFCSQFVPTWRGHPTSRLCAD